MDWSHVDYFDVLLSFWRHPFTAEDPWGWFHFQQIFILMWTILLNNEFMIVFVKQIL